MAAAMQTLNRLPHYLKCKICLTFVKPGRWFSKHCSSQNHQRCCRYAHTQSTPNFYTRLKVRGVCEGFFPNTRPDELNQVLLSPVSLYCGFDPTADSLHIGNLLSILVLLHGQRNGHTPIAVIGGATALIGDPSGKSKERRVMTAEEVENNVLGLIENVQRVFDNHQAMTSNNTCLPKARILNNRDWYKSQDVISFLSTTGRHFRLGEMLNKSSVQSRLNSKEGMSCTEFMYQVFQASDWLHLYQNYNCRIQIGGNDQTGNIASGFDLIHRITNNYVFGLLVPLILSPSGEKLGKSSGNSVWLDPKKSSTFEFYQYFLNLPDTIVERFLKLFTFLPCEEISAIIKTHSASPEKRFGQKMLAEQVTQLVHGRKGLESAQRCTSVLFGQSASALSSMELPELQQLFKTAPTTELKLNRDMSLKDLCMQIKCFKSDEDAERIFKAGGVYINQQRISDPTQGVGETGHILPNHITLIRIGKKKFYVVRWLA
ncbi:tyrosine--tRNA ligase [Plakobranchus ocellatus]|uniref:Tyrosine--tRNA ligase n=1 Tax=Plakobranchus ocellatus TaxID=259542 RepID=A0AAV3ZQY9_9GAST|nr:tyrosine--tRNA ligase [Plakobranchus ocellatus]